MDLMAAHERERRAEGARGFWVSLVLLIGTTAVGASLLTSPIQVASVSSEHSIPSKSIQNADQINVLQRQNEKQAQQIRELKTKFEALEDSQDSQKPTLVTYSTRANDSDHSDDNGDTRVVVEKVVTEEPSSRRTQSPSPVKSSNPDPIKKNVDNVKKNVDKTLKSVKDLVDNTTKAASK